MLDTRHREIGRRFRQAAAKIDWAKVRDSLFPLQEAYEALGRPAKLAGERGLISRAEKMDAVLLEAKSHGGKIFRGANDLVRQLSIDSDRDRFHAQLKKDRLSPDEIGQIIDPQLTDAELGARLVPVMDTFLRHLRDPVESRYKAIRLLALGFKDVLFSEMMRVGVVGVCGECGRTFVMASPRKRFCSLNFENRDCGARARVRRSYNKHAGPTMTRSESGRKAARARWGKQPRKR